MTRSIFAIVLTAMFSAPPAAAETTVALWYGFKDYFAPVFEKTIGEFNASQNDYRITWQGYDDYPTTMQAVIAAYRVGSHPPLAMIYDAGTATMMQSGAFVPMHEVIAESGATLDAEDFITGAVSYYADAEGKMVALPFFGSTAVMFANRNMLNAAGIERFPDTWEELGIVLKTLKDNGERCPFAHRINAWRDYEQMAAIHDEAIATNRNGYGGLDAELTLDSPFFVRHQQNLTDWTADGRMVLQGDLGGLNAQNAFIAGNCAMFVGSSANYAKVLANAKFDWSVELLPLYEGYTRHNSFIGGNALWVLDGHPPEVYAGIAALVDFIRQDATQEIYVRETGYVPVTRSAYEKMVDDGFFGQPEYEGLKVALDSLNAPAGDYSAGIRLGFYPQIRRVWKTEIEKAYAGEATVEDALKAAVSEGNALLRRFARTVTQE